MARAWDGLLQLSGSQIEWSKAVWCSTAQDCLTADITVSETVIARRTREEGFKALGVVVQDLPPCRSDISLRRSLLKDQHHTGVAGQLLQFVPRGFQN